MNYLPVIGLEIHLQVKTKSKMFCRCSSEYFSAEPNTHICPVCFGLPGALPLPNEEAFNKAIKLALALNCEIATETKFDRKNYFYPDLPKGYQISQFDQPIGENGFLDIEVGNSTKKIGIQRVHLEEDTAKSLHNESDGTLIDYNKSGVSLIEMVTQPDFESVEEVLAFAKSLRQIVRYTDVSDAEMQKGQMRFELNISVRAISDKQQAISSEEKPTAYSLPPYKVEVKNIGSISVLEKVINFEIARQSELLEKGEVIKTQTRGLKDMSGETLFQRAKESSDDYRYFPEPDIAPIEITKEQITKIQKSIGELPAARKVRYVGLGLEVEQAEVFVEDRERGDWFDEAISNKQEALSKNQLIKKVASWINSDIAGLVLKKGILFSECPLDKSDLIYLVQMIEDNKITGSIAKQVIEQIFEENNLKKGRVEEIIKENNLMQTNDESEIDAIISQIISENPKIIEDMKKNPNAIKFLLGQVMKLSKGRINPKLAEQKLSESLS